MNSAKVLVKVGRAGRLALSRLSGSLEVRGEMREGERGRGEGGRGGGAGVTGQRRGEREGGRVGVTGGGVEVRKGVVDVTAGWSEE